MAEITDFIYLPYTPELTQAGIAYACRMLPLASDALPQQSKTRKISTARRLQLLVGGVAVELALRRYLNKENIPYEVVGSTPFSDPDKFDITFGGRRVDVKTRLVDRKSAISQMRRQPETLLKSWARVPVEGLESDGLGMHDVYIFAYLAGLVTRSFASLDKAISAGQPTYLMHVLPRQWSQPPTWKKLEGLALKCDTSHTLSLEVAGKDAEGKLIQEKLILPPRTRTELNQPFHSLTYMHAPAQPDGQVGVSSPVIEKPYLIERQQWTNLWVYGLEIVLVGYLSRREFRDRAERLQIIASSEETQLRSGDELAVRCEDLRPLTELFDQARRWAARSGR